MKRLLFRFDIVNCNLLSRFRKLPTQLLKTSIALVRYWELPPGTVGPLRGSYSGTYNSGSRHPLAAPRAAPGSQTKHIQTQEPPKKPKKMTLHMSSSGAASPGAPSGATTHWRLQVLPLGAWSRFWKPFLMTI